MKDEPLQSLAGDFRGRAEAHVAKLSVFRDQAIRQKDAARLKTIFAILGEFQTAIFLFNVAMVEQFSPRERARICEKGLEHYTEAMDRLFSARMSGASLHYHY